MDLINGHGYGPREPLYTLYYILQHITVLPMAH